MSDEAAFETYTPCFDWVIQATGSQATALTYGVVWRYAQMSGARCYASCERLAGHLASSRQSVMRHLQRLLRLGLVVCANPGVPGVTREYLPVSQERWIVTRGTAEPAVASRDDAPSVTVDSEARLALPAVDGPAVEEPAVAGVATQAPPCNAALTEDPILDTESQAEPVIREPVPSADTPCDTLAQGPVPKGDTRNTSRNTKKKQSGTAACYRDPRIVLLRKLTGRMPPAVLREQVLASVGESPVPERLAECYRAWCARGYNPMNYAWLFDWYVSSRIPPANTRGLGAPPSGVTVSDPDTPTTAAAETFARWHAYQQAIQEGEQPDEVRRRLKL